jgi:hypothetical protein
MRDTLPEPEHVSRFQPPAQEPTVVTRTKAKKITAAHIVTKGTSRVDWVGVLVLEAGIKRVVRPR